MRCDGVIKGSTPVSIPKRVCQIASEAPPIPKTTAPKTPTSTL